MEERRKDASLGYSVAGSTISKSGELFARFTAAEPAPAARGHR
jgi:hypothetical protein